MTSSNSDEPLVKVGWLGLHEEISWISHLPKSFQLLWRKASTCVWPGGEKHQRVCGQGQSLWKHGACLPIVVFFFPLELSKYVLGIQCSNGKSIWALETCGISMAMLVYTGLRQRNCEFSSHLGRPNVASFNAVITACGLASKWQVWVCAGSWAWLSNCNKRWNVKRVSDS